LTSLESYDVAMTFHWNLDFVAGQIKTEHKRLTKKYEINSGVTLFSV